MILPSLTQVDVYRILLFFYSSLHLHLIFHIHNNVFFFFFNDPAPTEFSPLPLHDALPILCRGLAPAEPVRAGAHETLATIRTLIVHTVYLNITPGGPDGRVRACGILAHRRSPRPVRRARPRVGQPLQSPPRGDRRAGPRVGQAVERA